MGKHFFDLIKLFENWIAIQYTSLPRKQIAEQRLIFQIYSLGADGIWFFSAILGYRWMVLSFASTYESGTRINRPLPGQSLRQHNN